MSFPNILMGISLSYDGFQEKMVWRNVNEAFFVTPEVMVGL